MMTTLEEQAAAHRKKWKWRAYGKGDSAPEAGVCIISDPIILGGEMRKTFYDVEYDCCGLTARISHDRIVARARASTKLCRTCGHKIGWLSRQKSEDPEVRKHKAKDSLSEYGWIEPPWLKPSHVPLGYMLDCDKGGVLDPGDELELRLDAIRRSWRAAQALLAPEQCGVVKAGRGRGI